MGGMGMMMGNSLVQLVPVQLPNGQVRQQGEVCYAGGPGAAAAAAHKPFFFGRQTALRNASLSFGLMHILAACPC